MITTGGGTGPSLVPVAVPVPVPLAGTDAGSTRRTRTRTRRAVPSRWATRRRPPLRPVPRIGHAPTSNRDQQNSTALFRPLSSGSRRNTGFRWWWGQ
jgi:hypothetical protein